MATVASKIKAQLAGDETMPRCSDCMIPPVVTNLTKPETGFHYIENGKYTFIPNDGVPAPSHDEVKRLLVKRFGFRVVEPKGQLFDPGSTSNQLEEVQS